MDYESIKADVLKELESLGLPQSEIDRIILDFDNIVTKVSDDPSLMKRLATDLISAAKFRANLKSEVPNTIPEEVKSLQTDSKSTDSLGKQLSAKTAVFNEGEYAGRSIEDVWQNTVKNKRTPGTAGKSGKPDGSGLIQPGNMQDSYDAYDDLWKQWFSQNPDIYQQAVAKRKEGYTFVDTFGKAGNVRQDETIMRIIDSDWIPSQQNTFKYTDDFFDPKLGKITSLPDNHIFVFGSNTAGRHGKGAALDARNNFGAIPGQGYGLQGQSFGIPTKDGQLNVLDNAQIQKYVNNFLEFAKNNPDKTFVFTDIGTGLAGKNANEISSMLTNVPNNVILSQKFSKETKVTSRIVPKDTPGSILAMRGGDLPNPFYYQGGGPDAIVKISEGSTDANIAKVVELHKNWLETGNVPDGLSNDQIKKLADMREKQLNVIDNLPDDYKLGYYKPDATTSHAITLDNFIQQRKKNIQGGSVEFPLKKIISGMQKNVDQYGIEAAKVLGLDYGGTVNKGFKVVPEGSNSPNFQEFVDSGKWDEIDSQYYPDRTKANAQNADGTVWFGEGDSRGYGATKNYSGNKPWIENPTDVELRQWIIDNNIQTLNVAGNRSYGTEELGQKTMNTIIKAVDPSKQGGSLGAARFNDPNVFETFLENATADEKKMVKGLDESGKLDDVGGVKGLVIDLVTQYPQTAKVIGRSLGVFLQGAATIIDPIGEAIDLGLKLGGKKPVVGGKNAIKREAYTWALWQASAFGWTQIQDMGNIVNMTLNKVGLLPDWFTDKVDVPQNMEEVNAEYIINTEKNRRLGNQGYKATSLWWWLDQGIPARLTGLSPIEWGIRKWQYNQFGDITDDEKKFLDIMYGYDTRMEKNKESMFGWWQNEFDTNFNKKYYNEAHINDFRKIEKIKPEYGSEGVELYNDFKELGLIDE